MNTWWKMTVAAAVMATASTLGSPARADNFSIGFGNGGIAFSYESGGYCDRWGCPDNYWDMPIYDCPVYWRGEWYRGPVYYRRMHGRLYYWLRGDWRADEWRGMRPRGTCIDRFREPLGFRWYEDNGFRIRDDWRQRWHREHGDRDWNRHGRPEGRGWDHGPDNRRWDHGDDHHGDRGDDRRWDRGNHDGGDRDHGGWNGNRDGFRPGGNGQGGFTPGGKPNGGQFHPGGQGGSVTPPPPPPNNGTPSGVRSGAWQPNGGQNGFHPSYQGGQGSAVAPGGSKPSGYAAGVAPVNGGGQGGFHPGGHGGPGGFTPPGGRPSGNTPAGVQPSGQGGSRGGAGHGGVDHPTQKTN